jgi:hypothetical protein
MTMTEQPKPTPTQRYQAFVMANEYTNPEAPGRIVEVGALKNLSRCHLHAIAELEGAKVWVQEMRAIVEVVAPRGVQEEILERFNKLVGSEGEQRDYEAPSDPAFMAGREYEAKRWFKQNTQIMDQVEADVAKHVAEVELLERRVKLLQDAVETTIEDPVTRPEVMRHLQRCLDKAKALAEGREEDDTRPLEGDDGNIKCQFCGCLTNAKLRACCEKGREQDLRISESKTKAHNVESAAKDAFLNLFNVRAVLRKAVSLMAEPESIVELAEFVVKDLERARDGERSAKYDRYVLATEIMGAEATLGDKYVPLSTLLSTLRMNAIRLKAWESQKGSTLTVVELEKASNVIRFLRENFHNDGAEGESVWAACSLLEKSLGSSKAPLAASPEDLRNKGWMVVVHNDYRQNGIPHTFWAFSKGSIYVCGEGTSDAQALSHVRARVTALEKIDKELEGLKPSKLPERNQLAHALCAAAGPLELEFDWFLRLADAAIAFEEKKP